MEHNYDDFYYTGESGEAFDSKEIGKRIRLARKMRHISQTKLAEMLDERRAPSLVLPAARTVERAAQQAGKRPAVGRRLRGLEGPDHNLQLVSRAPSSSGGRRR